MLYLFIGPGVEPDDILSAVDLNLPNYTIESTSDNLYREASRWDYYTYQISFSSNESPALIKQLQEKNWEYECENNQYVKSVDIDDDLLTYAAFVDPDSGTQPLMPLLMRIISLYIFLNTL